MYSNHKFSKIGWSISTNKPNVLFLGSVWFPYFSCKKVKGNQPRAKSVSEQN